MRFLLKSTSTVVVLGPFVDATDGVTAETALSPSATNVRLYKAGATSSVDISTATWTHVENGIYRVTLTASHTDTAGPAMIVAAISGARPVTHEFNILDDDAYASLTAGTALPANMTHIAGNATAATLASFPLLTLQNIVIGTGSSSTRVATNLTESVADHWNGRQLVFVTGTLAKQATTITDYNGATKELTVNALTAAPASGDVAVIV